jgi:microcystin-dependent protein
MPIEHPEPPERYLTKTAHDLLDHSQFVAPPPPAFVMPAGVILDYGGYLPAPAGFLACDGASYLRADYPALFAAIGIIHGSVDGTHFNVPDIRERNCLGASGLHSVGTTGGANTHYHDLSNHVHGLGAHAHGMNNAYALIVMATGQIAYNQIAAGASWFSNTQTTVTITSSSVSRGNACKINGTTDNATGNTDVPVSNTSGAALGPVDPWIAVTKIIKT